MVELDIVVEPVFHGGPCRQLSLRPESANSRGAHVGAGVPKALQVTGLIAFFQSLSFFAFRHKLLGEPLLSYLFRENSSLISISGQKESLFVTFPAAVSG